MIEKTTPENINNLAETYRYLQAVGGLGLKNHGYIKKVIDVAEGRL